MAGRSAVRSFGPSVGRDDRHRRRGAASVDSSTEAPFAVVATIAVIVDPIGYRSR